MYFILAFFTISIVLIGLLVKQNINFKQLLCSISLKITDNTFIRNNILN